MAASEDMPGFIGALAQRWHDAVRAVITCPTPVVAGVQGAVAGAGAHLVGRLVDDEELTADPAAVEGVAAFVAERAADFRSEQGPDSTQSGPWWARTE